MHTIRTEEQLLARISRRRRLYRRTMVVLSLAVALLTFCLLTFPGITMEHTAVCGLQAHTHGEECFQRSLVCGQEEREASAEMADVLRCAFEPHRHTDRCRNAEGDISCGYTAEYYHEHASACYADGRLVCPLAHNERHEHTSDCYAAETVLICDLPETDHAHTDACYAPCTQEESAGHVHSEECWGEETVLACTLTEGEGAHSHTEECYEQWLACTLPETEGHSHGEGCHEEHMELMCPMAEGEGAHSHDDGCYTVETILVCTQSEGEEHSHQDGCYAENRFLSCTQPETAGHSHGEGCYGCVRTLVCAEEEAAPHTHGAECFESALLCELAETAGHQHDESCFALRSTLLCGLNEGDGAHTHSDGCKTLQCAEEGHRHGEGCYETSRYLVCGHPEPHEHTSDCFDSDGLALCGLIEMDEHRHSARCFVQLPADEGHVHTEECELLSLVCEKPEHEHTEACYPAEPEATATPEATIEPEGPVEPEAPVEPEPTLEPEAPVEPEAPAEPEPTLEPEVPIEPEAPAEPEPTAEPEAPIEPEAPAEPEPTLEPEVPVEPEAPAEPEPTLEPEAPVEPEATIVPEELVEVKSAETTPVPGVDVPLEPEMEAPAPTEDPEAGLMPETTPEPEAPAEPESSIAPTAEPDGLYICGLQEHLHNAPGANAISLLALFSEDSHTAFCYDDLGSLICPLPEHVHTEDCLAPLTDTVSRAAPTDIGALNGTTASAMQVKYNAETDRYEMEMNMGFAIIPADIVNAGYEYYLDIPNDLQLPGDLIGLDKSFNGYDKDGQLGFTYQFIQIDGHLRLLIHFIPEYVAQYTGVNAKLIEGYVNYKATADKVNDKGEIDLSFGDNLSLTIPARDIEYPANETSTSDLSLTKQGSYQEDGNKLIYTVTVRSMKGTPTEITLTDVLSHNNLTVKDVKLTSVQLGQVSQYGNTVSGSLESLTIPALQTSIGANQTSVSLTLPQLPEPTGSGRGHEYQLTFEYTLDDLPENSTFRPNNTVTGSSKTSTDRVESSSSSSVDLSTVPEKPQLGKAGSYADGMITWTITLNRNQTDIAGHVLSDEMINSDTELTITPDSGYTRQQDGSICFDAVSGGKNTQSYTITYQTKAPEQGWGASDPVKNSVSLDPTPGDTTNGDGVGQSAQVTVPGYGSAHKALTGSTMDGENYVLGWKLTINTPGVIAAGTTMTDTLEQQYNSDSKTHFFTKRQANALAEKVVEAFGGAVTMDDILFEVNSSKEWEPASNLEGSRFRQMKITFSSAYTPTASTVVIDYESTVSTSRLTGETTFLNTFTGVSNPPSWTYKPTVVKTNGDGTATDPKIEDYDGLGDIRWMVKVYFNTDAEDVTIVDTLPEGVTLTGLTFGENGTEYTVAITDGALSGQDGGLKATGSISGQEVTLRLSLSNGVGRPPYFAQGREMRLTYYCAYDLDEHIPPEGQTPVELSNSVTVTVDGAQYGSSSQTQTVTVGRPVVEVAKVQKGGTWNKDTRLVSYSVDINPEGKDLIYGSDTLTLVDKLSYEYLSWGSSERLASLLPSSVKLYRAQTDENGSPVFDENGRLIKKEQLLSGWTWSYSEGKKQYNPVNEHTITASIPDETPLIFVYQYSLQMKVVDQYDNQIDMKNTCELLGNSSDQAAAHMVDVWEESSTSAGVTSGLSYIFYKVDASDYSIRLAGAEFALYEWSNGAWQDTGHVYVSDEEGKITVHWQRSANAMMLADDPTQVDYAFTKNKGYYLVETKAPSGYLMPDNPPKFYFYFRSTNTVDYPISYPDGFTEQSGLVDLEARSVTAFCENTRNETSAAVEKVWKKGDTVVSSGPEVNVVLKRYKVDKATYEEVASGDGNTVPGYSNVHIFLGKSWAGWQDGKPVVGVGQQPVYDETLPAVLGSRIRVTITRSEGWRNPDFHINNYEEEIALSSASGNTFVFEFVVRPNMHAWGTIYTNLNDCSVTVETVSLPSASLYPLDSSFSLPVTLSTANSWNHRWDGLPIQEDDEWYLYFVEEPRVPSGYVASYSGGLNGANGRFQYTVTNTRPETESGQTELFVTKQWKHFDGSALTDEELEGKTAVLQLYQMLDGVSSAFGDPVTLSGDNGFTHAWEALPQTDSNGVPFTYYVAETSSPPGFTVTYGNGFSDPRQSAAEAEGTLLVTNTEKETVFGDVRLVKRWADTSQSAIRENGEVSIRLGRWALPADEADEWLDENGLLLPGADASALEEYIDGGYASTHTVSGDGTPTVVTGLPLNGMAGGAEVRYGYFAQEDMNALTGSFIAETAQETTAEGDAAIVITNRMTGLKLSIEKRWLNADGTPMTDPPAQTLYFRLLQNGSVIDPAPYAADWAQLEIIDGETCLMIDGFRSGVHTGTARLYGLPEADASGAPFTYTVEEFACRLKGSSALTTDLSGMDWAPTAEETAEGVLITNAPVVNIEFELPETGGRGTQAYTFGGLMLMLTAAALLLQKKREKEGSGR